MLQKTLSSLVCALCFLLLSAFWTASVAYGQGEIPPHIARIMEKLQKGQALTPAEEKAMEDWGKTMEKEAEKSLPDLEQKDDSRKLGSPAPCPKPSKIQGLPTQAPTRAAYLQLVKETAELYSRKAGKSRAGIDAALQKATKDTDGADLGAAFLMMSAGSASVYASSWSALHKPDDLLAANNLGVALKDLGDYRRALKVLLYAEKLRPNVPLITLNMAWVYYEMGDRATAKQLFEKAANLVPQSSSPELGLGLIAECQGNHALAQQHLRRALARGFSAVGAMAYKNAQEAGEKSGSTPSETEPISTEQGGSQDLKLPDPPISEKMARTVTAGPMMAKMGDALDQRMQQLTQEAVSLGKVVGQQSARASQSPGTAVVFSIDFEKELFLLEDITKVLFGDNSQLAKALDQAQKKFESVSREAEKMAPRVEEDATQFMALNKQMVACGLNDACVNAVQRKIDALNYKMCKDQKSLLDFSYSNEYKAWKTYWDAFKTTSADYYGFTTPILEKVYAPSFNELLNVNRELAILGFLTPAIRMGRGLPDLAQQYQSLECVPPEPPEEPGQAENPQVPKKKPKPCPFKKPLKVKIIVVSMELDCEHVKLEAGEGLLASVERNFVKHETTIWGGVGADVGFGGGALGGAAKMGIEMRVNGDTVQDVAVTSSVSANLAGLTETEVSGRWAAEGGPSVAMNTTFLGGKLNP